MFSYVFSYLMSGFEQLKTGDFSGGGRAGLSVYNSVQALAFFGASSGDGTFTFSPLYWSPGFNIVETGDINGHGKTDVLRYRPSDGALYAALGNGAGAFTYVYSLVQPNFSPVTLGDLTVTARRTCWLQLPDLRLQSRIHCRRFQLPIALRVPATTGWSPKTSTETANST